MKEWGKWNLAVSTTSLIPPTNWKQIYWSNESSKRSWLYTDCTINSYSLDAVFAKPLSSKPCHFVKTISFSIKLLSAHLQYACNIFAKCWKDPMKALREVYFKSMHYQPLFTRCSCLKTAKLKTPSFCPKKKNNISASNLFMPIFNMSATCCKVLKGSNESSKKSWFHKVCTTNHYLLGAVDLKTL